MASSAVQEAGGDVFVAIAHPVRRDILDKLLEGDAPVNRLAAAFDMTRPAVSQHLRVLREADLVAEQRRGRERYYHLNATRLSEVRRWVHKYERFWAERLAALGDYLDEEGE
jgi:DNA-binding transcriptional ArsR family regulator